MLNVLANIPTYNNNKRTVNSHNLSYLIVVMKIQIRFSSEKCVEAISQTQACVLQVPTSHCTRKAQLPVLVELYRLCQQHLLHNAYLTFC